MIRLLLAEDEEALREILCEGLREEGFDVTVAVDGAQALAMVRHDEGADGSSAYDVLLLDEEMPRFTGRQVVAQLRAEGRMHAALLFSGNLDLTDAERERLGVGPVLRKPLSLMELSAAIRAAARTP
jgi:two-component system response regulator MprA